MITSALKNATALAAKTPAPLLFPWNLDKREEETENNTKGKKTPVARQLMNSNHYKPKRSRRETAEESQLYTFFPSS